MDKRFVAFAKLLSVAALIIFLIICLFAYLIQKPDYTYEYVTEADDVLHIEVKTFKSTQITIKYKGKKIHYDSVSGDSIWNKHEQKYEIHIEYLGESESGREYALFDKIFIVPN